MLFHSSIFLFLFLPLVLILYLIAKGNLRVYFLLLASLFFYAWGDPKHVAVLLFAVAANYGFGWLIHGSLTAKSFLRKGILAAAIAANLSLLFYFKYFYFTWLNLSRILGTTFALQEIALPIGISFFTFKGISYVIDVYKKKVNVEKNPAFVALYLSFFPQLLAGPIVRYKDIRKQIDKRTESLDAVADGVKRFVLGLSKKVILANTLGRVADQIFLQPAMENTVATAWLGAVCYALQIYMDFSGYSDMAIGLGGMFGFRTPENFSYPYIARSLTDFWKRWHMSLSLWFRDYVYLPLSGSLLKRKWGLRSIYIVSSLVVWFLTGLWHGANVTFLVWGLWHALFLILERTLEPGLPQSKYLAPLRHGLTLLVVVIGWVFFRADGLEAALQYLGVMFGLAQPQNVGFTVGYYVDMKVVGAMVIAGLVSAPLTKLKWVEAAARHPAWKVASMVMTLLLLFVCIVFVMASTYNTFIYFQF